jgi:hypothetical protein
MKSFLLGVVATLAALAIGVLAYLRGSGWQKFAVTRFPLPGRQTY